MMEMILLVVIIYITTALLSTENSDTWTRHLSIETTATHKPRRRESKNIVILIRRKAEIKPFVENVRNKFSLLINFEE